MARHPSLPPALLSRDQFRDAVFARDNHRCVLCGSPGVDAHHLLERKLFVDGGYVLDNGATLCEVCHLAAEHTVVPVEDIRTAAGITTVVLPEGFDPARVYDKWGNVVLPDGTRTWGPLEHDDGARRALRAGLVLYKMMPSA